MNIDSLLLGAKKVKASDVHLIEDQPPFFRIAGDMKKVDLPPVSGEAFSEMLNKMMPTHLHREYESQRGADFGYQVGTDIRVRVVSYYEMGKRGLVMRLIPLEIPTVEDLELPDVIKTIAGNSRGMVLLTGMTGSGKSTTLAAMIDYINSTDSVRIITIEDPVEYVYTSKKAIISQREVGKDVPDFNSALRQAMRMDPDIILVGEMRDLEAAEIGIRAALTGHLVFSTLHTNDAPSACVRLIDMGVKPFMVASSLQAVIAQRLLRRICSQCKTEYTPAPQEIANVGFDPDDYAGKSFYKGRGCDRCSNSGYRGRTAIHEVFTNNPEIRQLIMRMESGTKLKRAGVKYGMRTLRMDGWEKAQLGQTTMEEVLRITVDD